VFRYETSKVEMIPMDAIVEKIGELAPYSLFLKARDQFQNVINIGDSKKIEAEETEGTNSMWIDELEVEKAKQKKLIKVNK